MGRGKVEVKKIENKISRQVTFSKRRSGLLKKAHEISILCDAHLALIVFSTKGKLSHFSSPTSMETILKRYEQNLYAEKHLNGPVPDSKESLTLEHTKLKAKVEALQRNHRHYMGEELDSLNTKELQNVENQLDNALKHVRSKKNQLMYESISELQKKEKALKAHNNDLTTKAEKKESAMVTEWMRQNHDLNSPVLSVSLALPSLNSSRETGDSVVEEEATESSRNKSSKSGTQIPPWMLRHLQDQLKETNGFV